VIFSDSFLFLILSSISLAIEVNALALISCGKINATMIRQLLDVALQDIQQETRSEAPEKRQLNTEVLNSKLFFPFCSPIREVLISLCLVLNPSDKLTIV